MGSIKDGPGGPVVFFQIDRFHTGEVWHYAQLVEQLHGITEWPTLGHLIQVLNFCRAPAVNCLIRISNDAHALMSFCKAFQELVLCCVGILRNVIECSTILRNIG